MTQLNKYPSWIAVIILFLVIGGICKYAFFPPRDNLSPTQALETGDLTLLEAAFAKSIDPNTASALNKRTFAHYLILKGSAQQLLFFPRAVKIFIHHGGDLNRQDIHGMTALHYAYKYNVPPESIDALLKNGANESLKDKDGHTPKMCSKPRLNLGY